MPNSCCPCHACCIEPQAQLHAGRTLLRRFPDGSHQCRAGDDPKKGLETYLIWKIKDCYLQGYSVDGSEDSIPKEKWSIKYNAIEVEYKETDIKTGKLTKYKDFKWDLAAGEMG